MDELGAAAESAGRPAAVGRVLAALGHVNAFGHVSRRVGADRFEITVAGDLALLGDGDVVELEVGTTSLPAGAPAEAWIHAEIYRLRSEVGGVARAQPMIASAAAAAAAVSSHGRVPALHGQSAWLFHGGSGIGVHRDPTLMRTRELARQAAMSLGSDHALLLRGNGAVTVGANPGLAVARMHLLATACEVWLQAASVSGVALVGLDADEAESWQAVGGELLPRLWRHLAHSVSSSTP